MSDCALTTYEIRTAYARRFPDANDHEERAARFDLWLAEEVGRAFEEGLNEARGLSWREATS